MVSGKITNISEDSALIMESTGSSETLVQFTRLHSLMSQRAAVFIATVVVDHRSHRRESFPKFRILLTETHYDRL
jgi:hypothetical protein